MELDFYCNYDKLSLSVHSTLLVLALHFQGLQASRPASASVAAPNQNHPHYSRIPMGIGTSTCIAFLFRAI